MATSAGPTPVLVGAGVAIVVVVGVVVLLWPRILRLDVDREARPWWAAGPTRRGPPRPRPFRRPADDRPRRSLAGARPPSVERVLQRLREDGEVTAGHEALLGAVRATLEVERERLAMVRAPASRGVLAADAMARVAPPRRAFRGSSTPRA